MTTVRVSFPARRSSLTVTGTADLYPRVRIVRQSERDVEGSGVMSSGGGLTEYGRAILVACYERMTAIAARPEPPAWRKWEAADLADLKEHGPRYEPGA